MLSRHFQYKYKRTLNFLTHVAKRLNCSSSTPTPGASPSVTKSAKCNYTIEEITIPTGSGSIMAGQLWKGEESSSASKLPPIICTHGTLDNSASFQALLPLIMKPNMKVLAIDFPGHGRSSHLKTGHYDHSVDGCKAILRTWKYLQSEKVILLGHSMGAFSSFLFAAVYPELTDRLIAIEFHPLTVDDPILYLKFLMESQLQVDEKLAKGKPPPSYTHEELLERLYQGRQGTVSWKGCQQLLERGATKLPDGKYTFSYDFRATIPPPGRFTMAQLDKLSAAIECPVTVVKAQPGGVVGFGTVLEANNDVEQLVECMKKHNVKVELHFVPGSHFVHINEPELIAPLVKAALKPLKP